MDKFKKSKYTYGQLVRDWGEAASKLQYLKHKPTNPGLAERLYKLEEEIHKAEK